MDYLIKQEDDVYRKNSVDATFLEKKTIAAGFVQYHGMKPLWEWN